jgi:hypothetical protein
MPHRTHMLRDIWLALGLAALMLALGAPAASAQTETPKVDGPTSGPKPEGLAQPSSETAPAIPNKSAIPERIGPSLKETTGEAGRPEGPVPMPERPEEPSGAPKEIR